MTTKPRRRRLRRFVSCFCLALAGCGGGGGGGGGAGVPTDTSAPLVSSTTPADGSSGLEPTVDVTVRFDEALDCATVVAGSVTLSEGSAPIAGAPTCSGDTVRFAAAADLPTRATLTATIGTGVTDAAGNALAGTYRWSFATRPWTQRLGTPATDTGNAVAVDAEGSVFVVGGSVGSPDGTANAGGNDALVAKYDRRGTLLWTRLVGLGDSALAQAVASDGNGGAFVAGWISVAPVSRRGLLARFDADGNELWSLALGEDDTQIRGLHVDANGDVLVTGATTGVLFGATGALGRNAFVAKYGPDGALRWGQLLSEANGGSAGGVVSDGDRNVIVAGYHFAALHGNVALGGADMVVVKYDTDGNRLWTRQLGTAEDDIASTVAVDANGRIYAGGRSAGVMAGSANAGLLDAVLVHLDTDGSTRWIRQFGSAGDDFIWSAAVDADGRAVVAGWAGDALPAQSHLGGVDAFTGVFAGDGTRLWLRQWGTAANDYAYAAAFTAAGDVISAGYTSGALDGLANLGESDVVVVKHAADGTPR